VVHWPLNGNQHLAVSIMHLSGVHPSVCLVLTLKLSAELNTHGPTSQRSHTIHIRMPDSSPQLYHLQRCSIHSRTFRAGSFKVTHQMAACSHHLCCNPRYEGWHRHPMFSSMSMRLCICTEHPVASLLTARPPRANVLNLCDSIIITVNTMVNLEVYYTTD